MCSFFFCAFDFFKTVCSRSLVHFYIATRYIRIDKTSLTYMQLQYAKMFFDLVRCLICCMVDVGLLFIRAYFQQTLLLSRLPAYIQALLFGQCGRSKPIYASLGRCGTSIATCLNSGSCCCLVLPASPPSVGPYLPSYSLPQVVIVAIYYLNNNIYFIAICR